jgi:hypothetical protein
MKPKLEKMFSIFKKSPASHLLCIFLVSLILIAPLSSAFAANSKITVMTRNLYLGADIFRVVDAASNPASIPYVVADVYQTMLFTNFWARAEAIADEIAANDPEVIGLNEVETFYIQTPGDFMIGNPIKAGTVVIDFYTVLNDALKARGMYYQAFSVTNADVELPMADANAGPPYYLSDVRMVDHDYILVRKGDVATQVFAKNYQVYLKLPIGNASVEFKRGCLAVDVKVKGKDYRIACTHPEVRSATGSVFRFVQSMQMQELLGTLNALSKLDPKPIIMVGDFNSSPDDVPGYYGSYPYVPPYMQAVAAGYLDSWLLQTKKHDAGYTDGFSETVDDPTDTLTSRIDLIFLDLLDLRVDRIKCNIVGDDVSDMVPNPGYPGQYLWPSDHAGVVADMQFKVPK